MYSPLVSFVIIGLSFTVYAKSILGPFVVHEKRTSIPAGWSFTRRPHASLSLPLRFALKQKDIENVGDFLLDVSDPGSLNYGKHWTASDITRIFAPSSRAIDAVRTWLLESGVEAHRISLSASKGWVNVQASVEEAERLMNTQYNVYKHVSGAEHIGEPVYECCIVADRNMMA